MQRRQIAMVASNALHCYSNLFSRYLYRRCFHYLQQYDNRHPPLSLPSGPFVPIHFSAIV